MGACCYGQSLALLGNVVSDHLPSSDVGVLPWPIVLNVVLGSSTSWSYGLSLYVRNSTCWGLSLMDLHLGELVKRKKALFFFLFFYLSRP
jgi:hypothetical protein